MIAIKCLQKKSLKKNFPVKNFGIVIPPEKNTEHLKKVAHFNRIIIAKNLFKCRLPDTVILTDGTILSCLESWKMTSPVTSSQSV